MAYTGWQGQFFVAATLAGPGEAKGKKIIAAEVQEGWIGLFRNMSLLVLNFRLSEFCMYPFRGSTKEGRKEKMLQENQAGVVSISNA